MAHVFPEQVKTGLGAYSLHVYEFLTVLGN